MSSPFQQIMIQTGYYAIVMIITIGLIGILEKGFFWIFVRVKLSFGRLVLVKIKAVNRDYYRVGRVEDNFLVYQASNKKDGEKRISVPDSTFFYKSIGCTWVDVDDEGSSLLKPDYSSVSGFDAVKYNNLYVRALTRPNITDPQDRIVIGILILVIVLIIFVGFLVYKQGTQIEGLTSMIGSLNKGVLVAGG